MDAMGYENGKIYKLLCEDGNYYLGSTIRTLTTRLSSHKCASKKTETNNAYNHIKTIGWEKVVIELVESFPCETREQLLHREAWHITQSREDDRCLNTRNPLTDNDTPEAKERHKEKCKDYYQQNRAEILHRRSEYHAKNREQRTTYNKTYVAKQSEHLKEYYKQYAIVNREKRNRLARERRKKAREDNITS